MKAQFAPHSSLFRFLPALLLGALAGCGGSSSDGGGGTNPGGGTPTVTLQTLSGNVRTSGGAPLPNVTVRAGMASALTDAGGAFILTSIGSLPVGNVLVEFDGSTALATGPIPYPLLDVMVPLPAGTTALVMPQVITLPDLNNMESANQSVMLNMDGTTAEAIDVVQGGGLTDISLGGEMGTLVTVGGAVGGTAVDLNVTPVPADEVPMPLPAGLVGNSFVTIQPGNAGFDQPDPPPPAAPVEGLDIVLPNTLGLAVGTMVDIWSFDHDAAAWVNRTEQTGQSGMVQPGPGGIGTQVVATGVITEGGWHTGAIPADPDCATTVMGRVVDQAGNGIAGASIAFSTGQFATTGADGSYTSDLVPAYDVAGLTGGGPCVPVDLCYEAVLPPCAGGLSSGKITIAADDIMPGDSTFGGEVVFMLPTTGSVAGVVIGPGATGEMVTLEPTLGTPVSVTPNATGSFFATGLEAGNWTASYTFLGEPMPTSVPFVVVANEIASVTIQMAKGGGDEDITVLVLQDDDNDSTPLVPCAGATVRLQGTDPVSSGGLVMLTDASGQALFQNVTGPFSVSAQKDIFAQGMTTRFTSSLVGIEPASNTIGVLLQAQAPPDPGVLDATLDGTLANAPMVVTGVVRVVAIEAGTSGGGTQSTGVVNPADGSFTLNIPSGVELDVWFEQTDFLVPSSVVATLLVPNAGQAASGGTLTLAPDFANAVPWDMPVDITFNNVPAGNDASVSVTLEDNTTGAEFFFNLITSMGAQPVTVNLPDVTAPGLGGLRFLLEGRASAPGSFDSSLGCELLLTSTPASQAFDFLGAPILTNPMNGASYTVAQLETLGVTYVEGANGSLGNNGALSLTMFHDGSTGTPPAGIDLVFWNVFAPQGLSGFTMPLTGLPVFGPGEENIFVFIDQFRFAGMAFDFNSFFNENLAANLAALLNTSTAECNATDGAIISTQ